MLLQTLLLLPSLAEGFFKDGAAPRPLLHNDDDPGVLSPPPLQPSQAQRCRQAPPPMRHGEISYPLFPPLGWRSYAPGARAFYRCARGFRRTSAHRYSRCSLDGTGRWSAPPSCSRSRRRCAHTTCHMRMTPPSSAAAAGSGGGSGTGGAGGTGGFSFLQFQARQEGATARASANLYHIAVVHDDGSGGREKGKEKRKAVDTHLGTARHHVCAFRGNLKAPHPDLANCVCLCW